MNAKDILCKWLRDHGYVGLCNQDIDCGCVLDDLIPCQDDFRDCLPAYRHPGNKEYDYLMTPERRDCVKKIDDLAFRREAFHLAMMVIESDLYRNDSDVREIVDTILLDTANDICDDKQHGRW